MNWLNDPDRPSSYEWAVRDLTMTVLFPSRHFTEDMATRFVRRIQI